MKIGTEVPGVFAGDGVMFVEDDMHGIAARVQEYDPSARLVVRDEDKQLGVAVRVTDVEWAPGGAWVVVFWARDPETGDALVGEPDARILQLQRDFDTHGRGNKERWDMKVRIALKMRKLRELHDIKERVGPVAERTVHGWKQKRGIKDKAFIRSGAGLYVPGAAA